MGDPDGAANEAVEHAIASERVRRPVPERTDPQRAWKHLYTLGVAADAGASAPPPPRTNEDDVGRVVRDGYRTLEENLRRGRQAAEELRETSSASALALRPTPQAFASSLARAFFDPALTRPLTHLAKTWLTAFSLPARADRGVSSLPNTLGVERIAMHPQARPAYQNGAAARGGTEPRLLRLSPLGPGEWVGDLALDGSVRRVRIRELEEL